jgi:hypothetical protein
VGNPPYIRNERLKDTGPWRKNYELVDFKNSDVAYFFVTRAIEGGVAKAERENLMPCWLEEGGKMCFVLPMALCDSDKAGPIREILLRYKIMEITDMEDVGIYIFPSPQASGRATVAPILFFCEKSPARDNNVSLVQVLEPPYNKANDASMAIAEAFKKVNLSKTELRQSIFHTSTINPHGHFLTKLRADDLPILNVLAKSPRLIEYADFSTPRQGIKVGAPGRLSLSPKEGLLPIGKGLNVIAFHMNSKVTSWVNLEDVDDKSIWGLDEITDHAKAFAVSSIALTPQCAIFNPNELALNNSTVIFVPNDKAENVPWDVVLNSSVIRYFQFLTLRAALVGVGTSIGNGRRASWCTLAGRTLSALPVPSGLVENSNLISGHAEKLRRLGSKIVNRSALVIEELGKSKMVPLAMGTVDFGNWESDISELDDLRLEQESGDWTLRPYVDDQATLLFLKGPRELLIVIRFLLEKREEEGLSARELQDLKVPQDYVKISRLIEIAADPDSADILEFKKVFEEVDSVVAKAYGLTSSQWKYLQSRVKSPPLDVLEPRWPWKVAAVRNIQEYNTDRFG